MATILVESDALSAKTAMNNAYTGVAALASQASSAQKISESVFNRVATLSDEVRAVNEISTFWGANFAEIIARAGAASTAAYALGKELSAAIGIANPVQEPPPPPKGLLDDLSDFVRWGLYIAGGFLLYRVLTDSGVLDWSKGRLATSSVKSNKRRRR